MTTKQRQAKKQRQANLMPNGVPKHVRCYDNNGESIDRYTVVFTGNYRRKTKEFIYLAMNGSPFHPQGFGQHGSSYTQIDTVGNSWGGPSIGRKHPTLGKRIPFTDLPLDCQTLVKNDYRELWEVEDATHE